MYVVLVQIAVRPEMLSEFERLLLHNARESVAHDKGCLRFDVSQHVDDPTRWVLHEVYDAPESHAAHRQSTHFLAYDVFARDAVIERAVARCTAKHVT
jgi:quinol monooxygenase YgiN